MTEALRLRTILVAMDFSVTAYAALQTARSLGDQAGPSHLLLVHAEWIPVEIADFATQPNDSLIARVEKRATEQLESILTELQDAGVSSEYVATRGRPEEVIVDVARQKSADLIVLGTHGRTGLRHLALGSIAERVVRDADCPVLTVRAEKA